MTDDAKERLRARGWRSLFADDVEWERELGNGLWLGATDYTADGACATAQAVLVDDGRDFVILEAREGTVNGNEFADLESACIAVETALMAWLQERLDALRGGKT